MATSSSREARRRRILERGTDRLSLITGQISTLPPPPPPPPPSSSDSQSPHHLPTDLPLSENKAFSSLLPNHDSGIEFDQLPKDDSGVRGPFMRKCVGSTETSRASSAIELDGEGQSSPSTVQNSFISTPNSEHHFEAPMRRKVFTPNQISSAIAASENTRVYCSLAAGILVVLSCVGFPILSSQILKSTIFFRPIYLVFLTNISIVLARLLLGQQRGSSRVEQEASRVTSVSEYGLADQVGKALESGLVLQNVVKALLMDCSVYVVMVICGLSLAQRLGW